MQPFDLIQFLLFAHDVHSHNASEIVCLQPIHIQFQPLLRVLPRGGQVFVPEDLVDSLVCLVRLCAAVTIGLVAVKFIWDYVDPKFRSISPAHKKWYVVANMFKACLLATIAFSSRVWTGAYGGYVHDIFAGIELKRCGVLYIATDVVSLYMVPKLPLSTVLHHAATAVAVLLISSFNLYTKGWSGLHGVCKMAIVYGNFSSVSFLVNAYLGLRVVYPKAKWVKLLCQVSLCTYIVCCFLNWSVHLVWLAGIFMAWNFSLFVAIYLVILAVIVHDDIVLIKWLIRKQSPMAATHEQ